MLAFLGALLHWLMLPVLVVLVLGTGLLIYAVSGTPRRCAVAGCTTNTWDLSRFCSHHIEDEYEEEHGRGSRPG